jgi:hypothetical protein
MTEQLKELPKALCSLYGQLPTIHEDGRANYGNYATLPGILGILLPALSKNGLAVVQTFEQGEDRPVLVTSLLHTSGERIDSRLPLISNSGRNIQHDLAGAISYFRRYALLAILGIAPGIVDDDAGAADLDPQPAAKPAPVPAATKPKLQQQGSSAKAIVLSAMAKSATKVINKVADEEQAKATRTKLTAYKNTGELSEAEHDHLLKLLTEREKLIAK